MANKENKNVNKSQSSSTKNTAKSTGKSGTSTKKSTATTSKTTTKTATKSTNTTKSAGTKSTSKTTKPSTKTASSNSVEKVEKEKIVVDTKLENTVENNVEQNSVENVQPTQPEVVVEEVKQPKTEEIGEKLQKQPAKKTFWQSVGGAFITCGQTMWRWTKRTFMGPHKEITQANKFDVEDIESPFKQMTKSFFRRKLAVAALILLVFMFLFVFIAPMFIPLDLTTYAFQQNIAPMMNFRSVPSALSGDVKTINGFGTYYLGVSNSNNLYIWGNTTINLQNIDMARDMPAELKKEGNVVHAAAGYNHAVAITADGKVVVWGSNTAGQYGDSTKEALPMSEELKNGINPNNVKQVVAGNLATAVLMKDGTLYTFGNLNGVKNLAQLNGMKDISKVVMTTDMILALKNDGTIVKIEGYSSVSSSVEGDLLYTRDAYLENAYSMGRKVVDIAASDYAIGILMDDGEIIVSGALTANQNVFPELPEGEKAVKISAGARHYTLLTNTGKVYSWGSNGYGQSSFNGVNADDVFCTYMQTYIVNENDALINSCGLSGFLMGTDELGRDIFARVVHGGKMTMTVGAVAVIVSSVIAIIVGCVSGYFGGWVDLLLMRITEVFASIPFLPFAMMLSTFIPQIRINGEAMSDTARIIVIMFVLGLLSWTGLAQMIRGQVMAEREKEFVIAAKAMGVKESKIAFKHILPNIMSVILVSMTLSFATCMLTESSLSYLGFGVQAPNPSWGNMLDKANNELVIQNYWWRWLFPAGCLALATISINIIGDTLRDVFDPKSSQEK